MTKLKAAFASIKNILSGPKSAKIDKMQRLTKAKSSDVIIYLGFLQTKTLIKSSRIAMCCIRPKASEVVYMPAVPMGF